MRATRLALVMLAVGTSLAAGEEPPYKRLLQGDDAQKAAALQKQVDDFWAAGKFAEAVAPAEEMLALRKRVQGEGHWEAADAARLLETVKKVVDLPAEKRASLAEAPGTRTKAIALHARGKYAEAEPLFRKALAVFEEVLGDQHPDTAASCNNLAGNLWAQGRAREAEPLIRKALAVQEELLGPKHPETARGYNNLASNLDVQARFKEAEPLFRKALAVNQAVLGPRHPHTANTCNNLASNLDAQGRAKEAEPLFRKALAVQEEVLGPRHPDTARGYNNLGYNLNVQGRAREAEPLYRKALLVRAEVQGLRHPDTASSFYNLATNLGEQGRPKEAEALLRKALAIWEEVLGPRHPHTALCYSTLASNLETQGRVREAEPLHRKALAIREKVLGPKHSDTAANFHNLASNLQAQGRFQEAEPLHRKALAIWEEVLGPRHPHTALGYNGLAVNLQVQGRVREAEPLLRRTLPLREQFLGVQHPDTALNYNNLAMNLQAQGRFQEAEPLHRKALAIREEVLGPRHPRTATSYDNLASNLQAQGRAREAEPLWKAGADAVETSRLRLASSSLDRAAAVHAQPHVGLATCLARLGRPADAWEAAEAGLARGLLDDLAARASLRPDPDAERRGHDRASRLDALDRLLVPLLTSQKLDEADRHRRDEMLQERAALDDAGARDDAQRSAQAVLSFADVQAALSPETALVFWVDFSPTGDHWGCVVRRSGPPAWVRLKGSGPEDAWTDADEQLPRLLREDLSRGDPDVLPHARRLAAQRLEPLAPHLAASGDQPAVRHLIVVPAGRMAGIPVEALTDRYQISYAPSGSVFARLRQKHRPLESPSLLALGDPNFDLPDAGPPPEPPESGLYLSLVLPGGSAAKAGLRGGDVLLRYGDTKLTSKADLKPPEGGEPAPISVWREGKTLNDLRLAPGKLGVVLSDDPPAVALRKRRDLNLLSDARTRSGIQPLPGTRLEIEAIAALLPRGKATRLLGSKASAQELEDLAASGKLKAYRLLHLATHGSVDPVSAAHSALELARDRLPGAEEQSRLAAAGKKVPDGRLYVSAIADWDLDADLVALSACETALGPDGGGEGLLGFAQVLLGRGARSLLLSLWKVDDTATALLMTRFYENLLGRREGLKEALPKAEALREAKSWLRTLRRSEAEKLAGRLARGAVRGEESAPEVPLKAAPSAVVPAGDTPFAHPRFWAAFILIGDPE